MKQIEVTAYEYGKIMDALINRDKTISEILISMIEEASKYKIVDKPKRKKLK